MKIKAIFSKAYLKGILILLAGLGLGWLFFHHPAREVSAPTAKGSEAKETIWTCAMHPQIRMNHPGKCPICGMDLIPLETNSTSTDSGAVKMTEDAIKLAEVETSIVTLENPVKLVRLYGKIQADERQVKTEPAHVAGRIEKLLVDFTGEEVSKGQVIAQIYSPELISAQKELLEAMQMKNLQPEILAAAREKLRLWKLTDDQISTIEKSGMVNPVFDVKSTTAGIVISKKVNVGDYVTQGTPIYEIADLSHVWAMFDAYERDLPWLKKGDRISFTVQSQPGKEYSGQASFIDPVINPQTRVARVRVDVANAGNQLKPEMFINGTAETRLPSAGKSLVIPQSSVLWTGTRSIVYKKIKEADEPTFQLQEITLGASLNNSYVVLEGLREGDEIVTSGTFSVDAAAQLAGKPSMMDHSENDLENTQHNANNVNSEKNATSGIIKNDTGKNTKGKSAIQRSEAFHVSGNCEMCKDRIESTAKSLRGVSFADWNMESKLLKVTFNPAQTSDDAIQRAIARVGHDTEKYKADDKVYKSLPECCLYRK